jgi:hypothetical protein
VKNRPSKGIKNSTALGEVSANKMKFRPESRFSAGKTIGPVRPFRPLDCCPETKNIENFLALGAFVPKLTERQAQMSETAPRRSPGYPDQHQKEPAGNCIL